METQKNSTKQTTKSRDKLKLPHKFRGALLLIIGLGLVVLLLGRYKWQWMPNWMSDFLPLVGLVLALVIAFYFKPWEK